MTMTTSVGTQHLAFMDRQHRLKDSKFERICDSDDSFIHSIQDSGTCRNQINQIPISDSLRFNNGFEQNHCPNFNSYLSHIS